MITIAGNGMGDYTFDNLSLDLDTFDTILCDPQFREEGKQVLKLGYREAKAYLLEHYADANILYVVTGSPLFYSAGTIIANLLPPDQVRIVDNTSSKSYMLSRCRVAEAQTGALSLHGRDWIDLESFLTRPYTFVLCDRHSIGKLQAALQWIDSAELEITIGYKLGYPDEQIVPIDLGALDGEWDWTQPYVLLIKRLFEPSAPINPDSAFATERGMITKQYKRHLSLQRLDLLPNVLLWDVGAGSGSCGIEAYTRYRVRTVFFEKQPARCEYIRRNLRAHHVCDARLIEGEAETMFGSVETDPDRIFVGGGGVGVIARLPYLYGRLNDGGVMLINAITLKNLTQMIAVLSDAQIAYEVISLSLTTYKGTLDMVEPERQLFQIKVVKP